MDAIIDVFAIHFAMAIGRDSKQRVPNPPHFHLLQAPLRHDLVLSSHRVGMRYGQKRIGFKYNLDTPRFRPKPDGQNPAHWMIDFFGCRVSQPNFMLFLLTIEIVDDGGSLVSRSRVDVQNGVGIATLIKGVLRCSPTIF